MYNVISKTSPKNVLSLCALEGVRMSMILQHIDVVQLLRGILKKPMLAIMIMMRNNPLPSLDILHMIIS